MKPPQSELAHKAAQYDRIVKVMNRDYVWRSYYRGYSEKLDDVQTEMTLQEIMDIISEKENDDK